MSITNAFETALLALYFNNVDHANIGDAAGLQNSASAGSFFVSLHTADPGEAGSQATSEANYTSYARREREAEERARREVEDDEEDALELLLQLAA